MEKISVQHLRLHPPPSPTRPSAPIPCLATRLAPRGTAPSASLAEPPLCHLPASRRRHPPPPRSVPASLRRSRPRLPVPPPSRAPRAAPSVPASAPRWPPRVRLHLVLWSPSSTCVAALLFGFDSSSSQPPANIQDWRRHFCWGRRRLRWLLRLA
jgi:hypothetical protein